MRLIPYIAELSTIFRRSIIEGTKDSLERLQLDYVGVILAHRPDNTGM